MLKKIVRSSFKMVFHYIVSPIVPNLPINVQYGLASLLARLNYQLSKDTRSAIRENLKAVLHEKSDEEIEQLVKDSFLNHAKHSFEILLIPKLNDQIIDKHSILEGFEYIQEGLDKGKGILFASGHMGCYYVGGIIADKKGVVMNDIVQDITKLELPKIDMKILTNRLNHYQDGIRGKLMYKGSFLRDIFRILKRNEAITLFVDAKASTEEVLVDFLGEQTYLQPGAIALGLRTGCTVLPVVTVRTKDNKWHIKVEKPFEFEKNGDQDQDVKHNLTRYAQWLESQILKYPDQWHLWRELHVRRLAYREKMGIA